MLYPLVNEFAADGTPIVVALHALGSARAPYYRQLASTIIRVEWE